MNCPREPNPGDPVSATYLRELVRYVRSLTPYAGPGMKIRRSPTGTHYESEATGFSRSESVETGPFRFRYVEQDNEAGIPYTGWEIYLPTGCLNVNSTCEPINVPAERTDEDGSQKTLKGWYRMPFPSGTPQDGDAWDVTVHAKVASGLDGVDELADWGTKNYCFAEIHKHTRTADEIAADKSPCGDDFSATVGSIEFHEVDSDDDHTEIVPTVSRTVSRPLSATVTRNRDLELVWGFEVDEDDLKLDVKKILLVNQSFAAAGTTFAANDRTEIPLATNYIYLKVSAETTPYVGDICCYANVSQSVSSGMRSAANVAADTGPFDIMVRIYRLENCRVKEDDRESARNIQLYK